jgi:hypothetical protein
VYGENLQIGGIGVKGVATAGTGMIASGGFVGLVATGGDGIRATGSANGGMGVFGQSTNFFGIRGSTQTGAAGILGESLSSGNIGYLGAANDGIFGSSSTRNGVYGSSTTPGACGLYGEDFQGWGVAGRGSEGMFGEASIGSSSSNAGVHGTGLQPNGNGLIGEANNGVSAFGVWGRSTSGKAGYFSGDVVVTGTLFKAGGSFKIDHPLDPANKYLSHSFVESPDMMNVYNGNITTDGRGYATISLPDWFGALNRDFRYQLTIIDDRPDLPDFVAARIASKIVDNHFTIRTSIPGVEVSWQVTGIRQDAWANAHRIAGEEEKQGAERGHYLHPELFGQPAGAGLDAIKTGAAPAQVPPSPLPTRPD